MTWIQSLNASAAPLPFAGGAFEILSWAYASALQDNRPHRHTYFEVCLVGEYGGGVFTAGETAYPLLPGTLFFARPGVRHQIQNSQTPPMELLWVCFGWTLEPEAAGEIPALCREFARSEIARVDGQKTPVPALWSALRRLGEEETSAGRREQIEGVAKALLLGILGAGSEIPYPFEKEPILQPFALPLPVRLAIRFLQDNLERPLSVEETALQVNVSSRHLARLFTEHLGVSPSEYLERTRLDRAGGLLRRTDLPIKEVASRTGFSSVHYFTRRFHHLYGVAPGAFRERGMGGPVRIVQKDGALV